MVVTLLLNVRILFERRHSKRRFKSKKPFYYADKMIKD